MVSQLTQSLEGFDLFFYDEIHDQQQDKRMVDLFLLLSKTYFVERSTQSIEGH